MSHKQLSKIYPVACHTDNISKGSIFVAIKGMQFNGINYIPQALQKGASKIVIDNLDELDEDVIKLIDLHKAKLIKVDNCRQALSNLTAQAYNYPADKLNIIGVTGTKGKTTCVYLMHHILAAAGFKVALISGVKNIINGKEYKTELTTPHPDYLHTFFNVCVENQVQFVVMEASAQGFSLNRLDDVKFNGGIFTNFDLEHSEFYNSMNDYFNAKHQMIKHLKPNAPFVVNVDNSWGKKFLGTFDSLCSLSMTGIRKNETISSLVLPETVRPEYPSKTDVSKDRFHYYFSITKNDSTGLEFNINNQNKILSFSAPSLVGTFNAYNLAGVVSLALQMDIPVRAIKRALLNFKYVPGRMERYNLKNNSIAIIDYAHNPSSFEQILPTLKSMTNNLIVVFGCGGSRDKTKRPIMGDIASTIADKVIITSDNPRFEKLEDIIENIYCGVKEQNKNKVEIISKRDQAIEHAYKISTENSIIAILGKGPDEYEMIGNEKFYFSDKETILLVSSEKLIIY